MNTLTEHHVSWPLCELNRALYPSPYIPQQHHPNQSPCISSLPQSTIDGMFLNVSNSMSIPGLSWQQERAMAAGDRHPESSLHISRSSTSQHIALPRFLVASPDAPSPFLPLSFAASRCVGMFHAEELLRDSGALSEERSINLSHQLHVAFHKTTIPLIISFNTSPQIL